MSYYKITSNPSFHAVTGVGSFHTVTAVRISFYEITSERNEWAPFYGLTWLPVIIA
jgi:hypothetical protein